MSGKRLVDRDVVEAGFARPVVGSGPVSRDGHADGERGESVVEPLVEVVGVEHDQHVRIDLVDPSAHRREGARDERLGVSRALTR